MGLRSLAGVNSAQEGRRYYMTAAAILLAELKRGVKNHLAYPIQAASEAIIVILIAIAVPSLIRGKTPWGVSGVIVEEPEKVVALVAVFVALVGLQTVHRVVSEESSLGTLEQLSLAPIGLPSLMVLRCAADTLRMMPIVLIVAVTVTKGEQIGRVLVMMIATLLLMNTGMLGIGFFLGSLTLVAKRLGFIPNLASIALLPLALSPTGELPRMVEVLASVLPFARGVELIGSVLQGSCAAEWAPGLLNLSVLGALWLAAGIRCFVIAERFAKDRGLLGRH
jgi:ABC-type transport system involved in cytochrome c biogenesis permease component